MDCPPKPTDASVASQRCLSGPLSSPAPSHWRKEDEKTTEKEEEEKRQKYNTVGQTGWCLDCDQEVIMRVFSGKCSANESLDLIISTGYLRPPSRSLVVKPDLVYMALPFISHPHARSN